MSATNGTALKNGVAPTASYYGRPVVKPHVWTPYIPAYFWIGGMAGVAAVQAAIERARGNDVLATVQSRAALAGALVAPVLLIADLGVPLRFYNMLRVFKPTSPMSVGSWVLVAFGGATGIANLADLFGTKPVARVGEALAALLGPVLATYTAVLIADTATPVWHESYGELPFVFVASGVGGAGAIGVLFTPPEQAKPARRLLLAGGFGAVAATRWMERGAGKFISEPYKHGNASTLRKLAERLSLAGAFLALVTRSRAATVAAGLLVAAGGVCERYAILDAGKQSAKDPKYTIEPQRARVEARQAATG